MADSFRDAGLRLDSGLPTVVTGWIAAAFAGTAGAPPVDLAECLADGFELGVAVHTLDDVSRCCRLLGRLFGLPAQPVNGVRELLVNGVEHGNLEIGFAEKSALLASGEWHVEIARRLDMPRYRDRRVLVAARIAGGALEIAIRDEGRGFDWLPYLTCGVPPESVRHGRGIVLARAAGFATFAYVGCGNEVVVRTALHSASAESLRRTA